MIGLPTQIQSPITVNQSPLRGASGGEVFRRPPNVVKESNPADSLRKIIAGRTGESLLVAFAMGGFLGWLTSKR